MKVNVHARHGLGFFGDFGVGTAGAPGGILVVLSDWAYWMILDDALTLPE